MLKSLALAALLLLGTLARAQEVKYEKYTLDNGLTVILHENHTLPVVAVNLWYRVGAQNEPKGRSGFAHLFEHLMFMGTERVPGNDFDTLMEGGGGSNNASTSLDRTNYFSSGPSSLLPTLLWLEADRMEDLGRTMTQEKLDKQRDIVRNEIRQNVENTPYGRMEETITHFMFPEAHPYHWNVYGLHEDLEAATVLDVKDFFATFYVPSNCSMVVAGDFDPAKIKPLIKSLFEGLPKGAPAPRRAAAQFPMPTEERVVRTTMLDKVDLPRIRWAFHSPAQYAPGDADLDLAAAILTQGKSSRLYKRLVLDEKLAVDVSATQDSAALSSMFLLDVVCTPEADLNRVETIVEEELRRLSDEAPSLAELEQRKATIELGMLGRLESILAVADRLNAYEYAFGEPNSFKRDLDRYRSATPDSIRAAVVKYLTPQSRVIMRCLPEEAQRTASARDSRPADGQPTNFTVPEPKALKTAGGVGLPVLFWPRAELPLVSVKLLITPHDAPDPTKAGLRYLLAEMLGEGAGDRDAVQFGDAVQALGADFSATATADSISIDMTVLNRNLDKAMDLMADAIHRPRLTETDFERVKRLHLEDLEQALNEPQAVASQVATRVLLGDQHPYALPTRGIISSVEPLSLGDIKDAYGRLISPAAGRVSILISGDVSESDAAAAAQKVCGDWKATSTDSAAKPVSKPTTDTGAIRLYLVDRPGAVQTVIRFATPAPGIDNDDRPALAVLNTILGGTFTSRLNQNLREDHGYTYGAGSGFSQFIHGGVFQARSAVKADVTGPALGEFLKEFSRLRGGPISATFIKAPSGDLTDGELTKARESIRTDLIQALQGHAGPMNIAADLLPAGLPLDTTTSDLAAISALKTADLNLKAHDAINLERGVLVLVGDKALILEQIKEFNLPAPIEVTPEGLPVK